MKTDVQISELHPSEAPDLLDLIAGQSDHYLRFAPHFRSSAQTLAAGLRNRKADQWWGLRRQGRLIGFFMLRGLDEGYRRPAFGVFIAEPAAGSGLASRALEYALQWCQREGIRSVMLKVHPAHEHARRIYLREGFYEIGICPETGQHVMEKRIGFPDRSTPGCRERLSLRGKRLIRRKFSRPA
ncbi:MAG: GNAT family N-acetyltransferase [Verrucomicrobiota bacterium]